MKQRTLDMILGRDVMQRSEQEETLGFSGGAENFKERRKRPFLDGNG